VGRLTASRQIGHHATSRNGTPARRQASAAANPSMFSRSAPWRRKRASARIRVPVPRPRQRGGPAQGAGHRQGPWPRPRPPGPGPALPHGAFPGLGHGQADAPGIDAGLAMQPVFRPGFPGDDPGASQGGRSRVEAAGHSRTGPPRPCPDTPPAPRPRAPRRPPADSGDQRPDRAIPGWKRWPERPRGPRAALGRVRGHGQAARSSMAVEGQKRAIARLQPPVPQPGVAQGLAVKGPAHVQDDALAPRPGTRNRRFQGAQGVQVGSGAARPG
jgi:hypothetical protein